MSHSQTSCCVPGCSGGEGVRLHHFPNPETDTERFRIWVMRVGGDIVGFENMFIFKNKRICTRHFEAVYQYARKLSKTAIPTLNLGSHFCRLQTQAKLPKVPVLQQDVAIPGTSQQKLYELTSSKMVKARKYVVKKQFKGVPKRDDFEIVEHELPSLQDGEMLIKTEWVSVDPYLRAYHSKFSVPYDQFGFQVGIVEESRNPNYPVGCRVVSHKGWCDYSVVSDIKGANFVMYKMPDLAGLPIELSIGAIGMVGATAYFGFLDICKPETGETVVVTGAAGAVGSIVGQIAKIKGCKVIGFAGSDDKVEWLEKELGFNKAFNYKTTDIQRAIKEAAPNGVDCYFDNVGGEISSIIINNMNDFGRVSVCGSISAYNEMDNPSNIPKASILQPAIVFKQLKIEGFLVSRWVDRWSESFVDLIKWIKSGELKIKSHVTEGFENIFDAFVGMLAGENFGKAVVKI